MEPNQQIKEEDIRRKMDIRVQPRNLKAQMYLPLDLQQYLDQAVDAADQAVVCSEPQPALGLFTPEELQRVQDNFQRYTSVDHD